MSMKAYKLFLFGGAGEGISEQLLHDGFDQDKLFFFDTDKTSFNNSNVINKFLIGASFNSGLGSGAKPKLGKQAFDEDEGVFRKLINDDVIYGIVGGLGGGIFTGMVGRFVEMLHKKNRKYFVIGTLPFSYEGRKRKKQAAAAVDEVNVFTDKLLLVDYNKLREVYGNQQFTEAFKQADVVIKNVIRELLISDRIDFFKKLFFVDSKLEDSLHRLKEYLDSIDSIFHNPNSRIIVGDINRELLELLTINPDYIYKISPRKFEELIEYIYRLSGLETKLTNSTRDDGADILVWTPPPVYGDDFLTIIQAKRYAKTNKVGSAEVRELIGSRLTFNADKAQIITTSDFSKPAIQTAKDKKVDLIKFYELNDEIKKIIS